MESKHKEQICEENDRIASLKKFVPDAKSVDEMVDLFKILSESNRFKIIHLLNNAPNLSVTEISKVVGMNQPAVSQHLKILRMYGILKWQKQGTQVRYAISLGNIIETYKQVLKFLSTLVKNAVLFE